MFNTYMHKQKQPNKIDVSFFNCIVTLSNQLFFGPFIIISHPNAFMARLLTFLLLIIIHL